MLSWEQAREKVIEIVRERMRRPAHEKTPLRRAAGRILAEPAVADRDLPPFPRAIRDGFAVRAADTLQAGSEFEIIAEIKAGDSYDGMIGPGQAARIMTGAAAPASADAVVMVEYAREISASRVSFERPAQPGQYIVPQASEGKTGETLLLPGCRIGFAEMALLAEVGCARPSVFRKPRVAVLTTGDEIVSVDRIPGKFQIRDTNSFSLAAQIELAGGQAVELGRAADRLTELSEAVRAGLEADLLVLSGGVSKGKYDLVKEALRKQGAELFFESVAIRPGRPAVFGWCAGKPIFGLPGNPVSTVVTFELLVSAAIDVLSGAETRSLPIFAAQLAERLDEKEGLTHFLPARLDWTATGPLARRTTWRGSGDLAGLARSNGFLIVPADHPRWEAGDRINILLRRDAL